MEILRLSVPGTVPAKVRATPRHVSDMDSDCSSTQLATWPTEAQNATQQTSHVHWAVYTFLTHSHQERK